MSGLEQETSSPGVSLTADGIAEGIEVENVVSERNLDQKK